MWLPDYTHGYRLAVNDDNAFLISGEQGWRVEDLLTFKLVRVGVSVVVLRRGADAKLLSAWRQEHEVKVFPFPTETTRAIDVDVYVFARPWAGCQTYWCLADIHKAAGCVTKEVALHWYQNMWQSWRSYLARLQLGDDHLRRGRKTKQAKPSGREASEVDVDVRCCDKPCVSCYGLVALLVRFARQTSPGDRPCKDAQAAAYRGRLHILG